MSNLSSTELTALAKAALFPLLYLAFVGWSITLLSA